MALKHKNHKNKGIIIVLDLERGSSGNNILMAMLILMITGGFVLVGGLPTTLPMLQQETDVAISPSIPKPSQTADPCGSPLPGADTPRTILKQPFAPTSIWNMPIGSGAVFVPINMKGGSGLMPQIDDEHIILKPEAPMTQILHSGAGWGGNRCSGDGKALFSVPIPADYIVPSNNTNSSSAFLMADGRTIMQSQPLARCTAGGPGTSLVSMTPVDIYGDGISGAHGGSNLSAIGGSIRVGELRPGSQGMKHAIKLNVAPSKAFFPCKAQNECFRWPASKADSGAAGSYGGSTVPGMKMGALLAIPKTVDIATLGLTSEPGKQLAWTLQNYGTYIVDSTGGLPYAISAEEGPDGSVRKQFQADYGFPIEGSSGSSAWTRDFEKLMTVLQLVDNNSPTTIGGGGTPLQPLAAPIAPK